MESIQPTLPVLELLEKLDATVLRAVLLVRFVDIDIYIQNCLNLFLNRFSFDVDRVRHRPGQPSIKSDFAHLHHPCLPTHLNNFDEPMPKVLAIILGKVF
jgi:hypothetical protein